MPGYVLDHHLHGEGARLALMSRLLDPMHRRYIEALGIGPGARTLEVGFGNGSVSSWLAELVGPTGQAVAVDIDLSLVDQNTAPANLDYLQADIVAGPVDPGTFDLVTARAVLHHVTDVDAAMRNLVASLAPGGAILLIEPADVVARAGHRLLSRPHADQPAGRPRPPGHRGYGGNRCLPRRFAVGHLLGRHR